MKYDKPAVEIRKSCRVFPSTSGPTLANGKGRVGVGEQSFRRMNLTSEAGSDFLRLSGLFVSNNNNKDNRTKQDKTRQGHRKESRPRSRDAAKEKYSRHIALAVSLLVLCSRVTAMKRSAIVDI